MKNLKPPNRKRQRNLICYWHDENTYFTHYRILKVHLNQSVEVTKKTGVSKKHSSKNKQTEGKI